MKHSDALITNVKRNKFNELCYTVKVKEEDYVREDYEYLRECWQEGIPQDVEVGDAESSTKVNLETGEIINPQT